MLVSSDIGTPSIGSTCEYLVVVDSHTLYRRAEESWLVLDRNIKVIKCDFIICHICSVTRTQEAARHLTAARAPSTQGDRPDGERTWDRVHTVAGIDRKADSVR